MPQTAVPFLFLRGGTSRGPYFRREDLPADRDTLAEVLMAAIGAGHPLNIDGIGGGAAVTTKAAMLSPADHDWAEIDYFFAQVAVTERLVDFKPSCGNILAGVGPAAIEMGLVAPGDPETRVRIRAVNTGALVEAVIQTPGGKIRYDGDSEIDGVPGSAAPIQLNFSEVTGSATGALFPTGRAQEAIEGIDITCIDVAMPLAIARAEAFGLTGTESREDLDADRDFFARMEAIRLEAGRRMGLGDVTKSVIPKFALLAPPRGGGTVTARYFTPWNCHPTMAVTGAQCIAACTLAPGTVAEGLAARPEQTPALLTIEHPAGHIDANVDFELASGTLVVRSAGLVRTARLLARGEIMVPAAIWPGGGTD